MTRTKAASDDVARIEGLIADLEHRLRRPKSKRAEASSASDDIPEFLSGAFGHILGRVGRDEAFAYGSDDYDIIDEQIDRSPLATLAVAAGIGFLLGSARRP